MPYPFAVAMETAIDCAIQIAWRSLGYYGAFIKLSVIADDLTIDAMQRWSSAVHRRMIQYLVPSRAKTTRIAVIMKSHVRTLTMGCPLSGSNLLIAPVE